MSLPTDADLQAHKFLKDAAILLGTIDNLRIDGVSPNAVVEALPEHGSIAEMATRLRAALEPFTHATAGTQS